MTDSLTSRLDEALSLTLETEGLLLLFRERADGDDTPVTEIRALLAAKVGRLAELTGVQPAPEAAGKTAEEAAVAASAEFEERDDALPAAEPEPAQAPAEEAEPEPEPEAAEPAAEPAAEGRSVRSLLSINDMFRFRRELFCGSDAQMTDALDMLDAMRSLPEAEEYFYADLGWDRTSPEVAEFMERVSRHFS